MQPDEVAATLVRSGSEGKLLASTREKIVVASEVGVAITILSPKIQAVLRVLSVGSPLRAGSAET
jgi:hypothetical protein